METELCGCGQPLHYVDKNVEWLMREIVSKVGPDVLVTVGARTWSVSRHYIALHGIKADEIEGLGFPEVTPA